MSDDIELSVIMPFCNEYPQVVFTIRAIAEELLGRVSFEFIPVNNFCTEVECQGKVEDKGMLMIQGAAEGNPWLIPMTYDRKLSHWQAKNLAVRASRGKYLWFPDAHVSPSRDCLFNMLQFYKQNYDELQGSINLPITYQILEWRRLIYGLIADPAQAKYWYQFVGLPETDEVFQTPVMSTCGMLCSREIFDKLGGWPEEIGIYGGGEPFFNFAGAVMGLKRWIWPHGALHHYGETRGYSWNHPGWIRDELLAVYMFGGERLLEKKIKDGGGEPIINRGIAQDFLALDSVRQHRALIKSQQIMEIEDWVQPWL